MHDMLTSGDESPETSPNMDLDQEPVSEPVLHKQLFNYSVTVNAHPGSTVNVNSAVGVQSVTNTELPHHDGLDQVPSAPARREVGGTVSPSARPLGLGAQWITLLLCLSFVAGVVLRYLPAWALKP